MKQLLLYISIITLIGCTGTGGHRPSEEKEGAVDTVYTEPAAMSIHRNEPDRALAMIDSAVIVGNITPQRAEYLRAIIQYGGKRDYNLSRQTCLNLLKEYEINYVKPDNMPCTILRISLVLPGSRSQAGSRNLPPVPCCQRR